MFDYESLVIHLCTPLYGFDCTESLWQQCLSVLVALSGLILATEKYLAVAVDKLLELRIFVCL